jgi:hypothetical protein
MLCKEYQKELAHTVVGIQTRQGCSLRDQNMRSMHYFQHLLSRLFLTYILTTLLRMCELVRDLYAVGISQITPPM